MCKHIGWLILAVFLVAGGCDTNILGRRVDNAPPVFKIISEPNLDARVDALDARVKTLENWAVKQGAKFK